MTSTTVLVNEYDLVTVGWRQTQLGRMLIALGRWIHGHCCKQTEGGDNAYRPSVRPNCQVSQVAAVTNSSHLSETNAYLQVDPLNVARE